MTISRRAFGLGLLATGVAATGGYVAVKDRPDLQGIFGQTTNLFGFLGGEKQSLLDDPDVIHALGGYGLKLDARVAGSVEMVRERQLLDQRPTFLWPSSSIMVDIAKSNGVQVRNDQVVLNSPIVLYSWSPIAESLEKAGLVSKSSAGHYQVDVKALMGAVLDGADWKSLGVDELYGKARFVSTDPNRSNSGFVLAGLMLNLFTGDIAATSDLTAHGDKVAKLFRTMGFKSPSSGKLFEQYLAGGIGGEPMIFGYENQLVEWTLADPARWDRIKKQPGAKPVILYPTPTVYSAHPMIVIDPEAERLLDVLMGDRLQEIAWTKHGFRGPLGVVSGTMEPSISQMLPTEIDAVMRMPDANVMLELLRQLA